MARYFTRPQAYWHDSEVEPLLEGQTIFEPEPVNTGLLDANGGQIWKRGINPIGFVELKERG
jgi:hypothetical protein